jgi:hypothetical protein
MELLVDLPGELPQDGRRRRRRCVGTARRNRDHQEHRVEHDAEAQQQARARENRVS